MDSSKQSVIIGQLLFGLALCFAFFGTIMVFSSSAFLRRDLFMFFAKQATWTALGVAALLAASKLNYTILFKVKTWLLVLVAVMLGLVLWSPYGVESHGARRWLAIGPVCVQPSEAAKFAVVIFLADVFGRNPKKLFNFFRGALPPLALCGIVVGLIFFEPDRSMTLFIMICVLVMWIMAGARKLHFVPILCMAALACVLMVRSTGTGRRRWEAYKNQDNCSSAAGYQVCQSKIALARGGVGGVGVGQGRQKLFFLPEPHTDFIFSIIGEEMGFLGCATILFGFGAFAVLGTFVARRAIDFSGALLAGGVTFVVGFQALLNLSVATGVIPPTGIALPFISYGGSSLVTSMGATGILINVARTIR